jgi:RNA polymerase sigma-70 factor (sigma-E family)
MLIVGRFWEVASLADWKQGLTTLVRLRGAELKRYAYLLCGDAGDAEDLVQDALVRTFTFARRAEVTQLEQYVRKVILNLWVDRTRRRRVWRRLMPLAATSAHQDAHEHSDLAQALRRLSARQRACVVLHYYVDLPVSEIATQLEISVGSVKRHLHDARSRLAEQLGVDPDPDPERWEGGRAAAR